MENHENSPPAGKPDVGTPWGLWATLGFGAVIAGLYLGVQIVGVIVFVAVEAAGGRNVDLEALATDGVLFGAISLAASLAGAAAVVGCTALRRGISIADYLHLDWPGIRKLALWTVLLVGIFWPLEWVRTGPLGQPDVPDSMLEVYRNCDFLPILWLAIVVGAPLGEEFFFRGFLFEGIRHSRLGPIAAVVICAITWAVIHFQYNVIDVGLIFFAGLFLGVARLKTGSLWVAVFLHFVWNLVSIIQTAVIAQGG